MTTAVAAAGAEARVNKWFVATAVALGALLEIIDTSIVNVALADMQSELGATLSQVSWVVSSYAVANVIILPLSAWLGLRFGKKKYFVFSLVGFTAASVLCGLATSLPLLIVARVLQGLMGGGLLAKAQAILFETFPREEQAAAQGFFGAIVIAGPVIGPTLGGYIVTNIGWRWIFFINVPVGILAVIMVLAALPQDAPGTDRSRVDWLAILLLAVGLGALQTMLEEGSSDDWFQSSFIVAMAVTAAAGLVAFVLRELSSDRPVVDLRVLRYRSLWAGSLLSLVVGMALYGALFALPIFAQSILGMSSQQTGVLLLPGALVSAACMPLAANLTRKYDPRVLLAAGGVVLVVALVQLAGMSPQTGEVDLFWPLIIRSFGTVFMFLPLSLAAVGPIPRKDMAAATGFYNLTRQLGGSIGVAILATILSERSAFHRAVLAEKLVPSDPHVVERIASMTAGFAARGMSPDAAHQLALGVLDRTVQVQAAVMSFGDTFWFTAALVLCFLPLVLILGRPAKGAGVAGGH